MLAIILFLSMLQSNSLQDEFIRKLLPFDKHYLNFKVELLGCPESYKTTPTYLDPSKCNLSAGTISTKEWILLRKAAMSAFELQEIK